MSVTTLTIIIACSYLVYFLITFVWMRYTFKWNTLNKYAFNNQLRKEKQDLMHYVELAMVVLLLIGLLTTIISQIQIFVFKWKGVKPNDYKN